MTYRNALRAADVVARRAHRAPTRRLPSTYDRQAVFERWGRLCAYGCGRLATELDHVTPLSRGGLDVESNVLPVCADENREKADRSLAEWAQTFA